MGACRLFVFMCPLPGWGHSSLFLVYWELLLKKLWIDVRFCQSYFSASTDWSIFRYSPSLHSRDQFRLVMAYNPFYMLLDSVCWYFVKGYVSVFIRDAMWSFPVMFSLASASGWFTWAISEAPVSPQELRCSAKTQDGGFRLAHSCLRSRLSIRLHRHKAVRDVPIPPFPCLWLGETPPLQSPALQSDLLSFLLVAAQGLWALALLTSWGRPHTLQPRWHTSGPAGVRCV